MLKTGRNDPCPCGSGKKHKRCCLGRPAAEVVAPSQPSSSALSAAFDARLSPYTIAKIVQDPRSAGPDPHLRRLIEQGRRDGWTIEKVAAMSTAEIVGELARHGVTLVPGEFEILARGRHSAWAISETWVASSADARTGTEEDFLGLAACELWKRLLPERPSIEMLDDWMQEGYALVGRRENGAACDLWWRVWSALRPRFAPAMTTMLAAEPAVFNGRQSIHNWSQDFETALLNASLKDRRYSEMGRDFCAEWIAQFTGEEEWAQVNFRRPLAEHLAKLGEVSRAEAVYREISARWPGNVWGWVAQADARSGLFGGGLPLDFEAARACLQRALELPDLRHEDRKMLRDRMAGVEKRAGER